MRIDTKLYDRRTTIRIPDDLWQIYVEAVGTEEEAKSELLESMSEAEPQFSSPSQVARSFITGYVRNCLKATSGRV